MKTISLLSFIMLCCSAPGISQWNFNLTTGFSPKATPVSAGLILNRHLPHEEFVFSVAKVNHQFFMGLKAQMEMSNSFFADIGLTYTKQNSTFQMDYTLINDAHPQSRQLLTKSKHLLVVPVNIGARLGAFDMTSGFRAFHTIEMETELDRMRGFSSSGSLFNMGWQWGGGFYMSGARVGVEYQGNFSRLGSDINFNGQSLVMMNIPGQWILTFQHRL